MILVISVTFLGEKPNCGELWENEMCGREGGSDSSFSKMLSANFQREENGAML